jgi:hypothetical protein
MATMLLGTELPAVPRDSLRVGPASPALRRLELGRFQELLPDLDSCANLPRSAQTVLMHQPPDPCEFLGRVLLEGPEGAICSPVDWKSPSAIGAQCASLQAQLAGLEFGARKLADQEAVPPGKEKLAEALRGYLAASTAAAASVERLLVTLLPYSPPTTRQGYLQTLPEAFPRPDLKEEDVEKMLKQEWDAMCREHAVQSKSVKPPPSYTDAVKFMQVSIDSRVTKEKWDRKDAETYTLLSSVHARGPMSRALASKQASFAASAYALTDVLKKRVDIHPIITATEDRNRGDHHPARFYRHLDGPGSLREDDETWHYVLKPDATGFVGLTACALVRPTNDAKSICRCEGVKGKGTRRQE